MIAFRACLALLFIFSANLALRAQAPAPGPVNDKIFYRIEGPDGKGSSWLFGTMHSPSKEAFGFNVMALRQIESVESFAAELDLNPLLAAQAQSLMLMPEGKSLKKLLSKKDYKLVEEKLKAASGAQLEAFDRMQPIFLLAQFSSEKIKKADLPMAMDMALAQYAKGYGKPTFGLETIREQMQALGSLSLKDQAKMLVDAARKHGEEGGKDDGTDSLMTAYREGKLEIFLDPTRSEMPPAFFHRLVTVRNLTMAHRLDSAMRVRSCFAAVGALHLPGDSGVVALLRAKGWKLTAVPLAFDGSAFVVAQRFLKPVDHNWMTHNAEDFSYRQRFPAPPEARRQSEGERNAESFIYRDGESGQTYALHVVQWGAPPTDKELEAYMEELARRYGGPVEVRENVDLKQSTRRIFRTAPESPLFQEVCGRVEGARLFVQVVQLGQQVDRRRQRADAFFSGLGFGPED